jgi:hypothetical protein
MSTRDLADIFDQSNMDFKSDERAVYIPDKQNMIAIGKDNYFQIISQVGLTGCLQRHHLYFFDKHHVLRNNLEDTCLGAIYLRPELGVQKHCKFKIKPVSELVYQISDTDHLVFSPNTWLSNKKLSKNLL